MWSAGNKSSMRLSPENVPHSSINKLLLISGSHSRAAINTPAAGGNLVPPPEGSRLEPRPLQPDWPTPLTCLTSALNRADGLLSRPRVRPARRCYVLRDLASFILNERRMNILHCLHLCSPSTSTSQCTSPKHKKNTCVTVLVSISAL